MLSIMFFHYKTLVLQNLRFHLNSFHKQPFLPEAYECRKSSKIEYKYVQMKSV